ncbi:MAG: hypothetical protein ACOX7R_09570 [Acetivibrionales bacterium]|jgi:hypothetical protein
MLKKSRCIFLFLLFIICFSVPVFANPGDEDTVTNTVVADQTLTQADTTGQAVSSTVDTGDIEGKTASDADEDIDEHSEIVDGIVSDPYIEETEQFLVDITSHEHKDIYINDSNTITIAGVSVENKVKLIFAMKDDETGEYGYFKDDEGSSSWDIQENEWFTKNLTLDKEQNRLKIVAYRASEMDNLVVGENVQVNYFNINILKKSTVQKVADGLSELINSILNKNN